MSKGKPQIDTVTGVEVRQHEWDGIQELNNPLPRWWLWLFLISVVWALGYWVVMPSWPLIDGYTRGVIGWSQRANVARDMAALQAARKPTEEKLLANSLDQIERDPDLFTFAMALGRSAFKDNCAPCHGAGAQGAVGYPNLNDDDWLWGGTLAEIEHTISFGVRTPHPDSRFSEMPAFLTLGTLTRAQVADTTEYVLALAGRDHDAAAAARGQALYVEHCASCHGEDAKGLREQGSPNLTDGIWLYGSSREAIFETIAKARNASMPTWGERLPPATVRALAVYVHALGGGERTAASAASAP